MASATYERAKRYRAANPEKVRQWRRKHYERHRVYYVETQRLKRRRMKDWIIEQKARPCADCHKSYPYYVMDFDHRDGVEKVSDVNQLVRICAWKRVRDEIAKCDLVCSNCHRIRTHQRARPRSSAG